MKLTEDNYVELAEKAIKKLCSEKDKRGKEVAPVTTSKIRNLLAMTTDIYNQVVNLKEEKLLFYRKLFSNYSPPFYT